MFPKCSSKQRKWKCLWSAAVARLTAYSFARLSVSDLWGKHWDGWECRDVSSPLAEPVRWKSTNAAALCSTQTFTELSLRATREEKCLVTVLQCVHRVLLWGSWGQLALMTWIVSQLCFYLCVLQPSPGLQNSRESEVVAAHSSSVTWKCSCMKQTAPRGPTAVVDTPTETPLGCIRTLAHL